MKISTQFGNVIFILILISLSIISCKEKSGPKIGFMLPHMTIKRYIIEKEAFTAKIKELGGEVIFMSADNDEEKQNQQVNDILDEGIDVLVLDPVNRFSAAGMVRAAHNKGIPVISYDRLVANCDVDNFLTFDATAVGTLMTNYVLSKKPEGNYIILGGDKSDINAVLIDAAIEKSLSPSIKSGKIKIVYKSFIEKYSEDDASHEIVRFFNLTSEKPDVILACSDILAKGAINGIKKAGFAGNILITGQGGELIACKNILINQQSMTVYKPIKKLANLAAEISFDLAKNENIDKYFKTTIFNGYSDIPCTFLEVISVNAANIRSTVVADGLITESELTN